MEKIHDPNAPPIDTNVEYISTEGINTQPPVIVSVFRSIFVETPKDLFNSIKNFFLRYINLFKDGIKYLRYPTIKSHHFAVKDYKDNCQLTFEFALIVIAILIFLIKMDWITGDEKLKAYYNNDVAQALIQFMIFVIFAIVYFLLIALSAFAGRFYRLLFKIPVSRQECDILFTYLNNTFFLFTASIALVLRCFISTETAANNEVFQWGVGIFYAVALGVLIFLWARRFAALNKMTHFKGMVFEILITLLATAFFTVTSSAITFFIMGV